MATESDEIIDLHHYRWVQCDVNLYFNTLEMIILVEIVITLAWTRHLNAFINIWKNNEQVYGHLNLMK